MSDREELLRAVRVACDAVESLESIARTTSTGDDPRNERLHLLVAAATIVLWEAAQLVDEPSDGRSEREMGDHFAPDDDEPLDRAVRRWAASRGYERARIDRMGSDLRRLGERLDPSSGLLGADGWTTVGELRRRVGSEGDLDGVAGAVTPSLLPALRAVLGWSHRRAAWPERAGDTTPATQPPHHD